MDMVLLIAGMTAVTFGARYPMLVMVGRVELPARIFEALKYVPVAVLTAICTPIIVAGDTDSMNIALNNAHLVGGVGAAVIAWHTKRILPTVMGGMALFLLWQALM